MSNSDKFDKTCPSKKVTRLPKLGATVYIDDVAVLPVENMDYPSRGKLLVIIIISNESPIRVDERRKIRFSYLYFLVFSPPPLLVSSIYISNICIYFYIVRLMKRRRGTRRILDNAAFEI